jgi:hypothetical protein
VHVVDGAGVAAAAKALSVAGETGGDFCEPFVRVLQLSSVAVSTLGDPFGSETLCASDDRAARADELQIDFGEGPGWQSLALREPVIEPDLEHSTNTTWPLALDALQQAGLGAVFAFPLVVAGINVGALDLYSELPIVLTDQQISDTTMLSMILARQVFHKAVHAGEREAGGGGPAEGAYSRREIHQATGMVLAQLHITPNDALLVLRGHAFASGRTVLDVAVDVVNRSLDFSTIN